MSNLLFFVELDPEVVSIGKEARQALLEFSARPISTNCSLNPSSSLYFPKDPSVRNY